MLIRMGKDGKIKVLKNFRICHAKLDLASSQTN